MAYRWIALSLILLALAACAPPTDTRAVIVVADGKTRTVATEALTVRDLLTEVEITLDADDRAVPAEPTLIKDDMTVRIIRVETRTETKEREIPFDRRTVRDASISEDETQLLEPGVTGIEELTYRVTLEDGIEVDRSLVRRITVREPRTEVILVGARAERTPIAITGTIAYIADHNAWVIRGTSANQRRLGHEGDLDGRVFALSPDGSHLLLTRVVTGSGDELQNDGALDYGSDASGDVEGAGAPSPSTRSLDAATGTGDRSQPEGGAEVPAGTERSVPLNTLWVFDTSVVDAEPVQLDVENVLWAAWEPDCDVAHTSTRCRIAYTTGRAAEGNPGWRAENDLWIARPRPGTGELVAKRRVLEPAGGGSYGWWGTTYAWSPGGQALAYARADEVGVVRAYDGQQTTLAQFPPYRTYAPWVWAPSVHWSPEGLFIVTTLHASAPTGELPEDSPVFDVWVLSADGTISAELSSEAGMWAEPSFAPQGGHIAFGRARSSYGSQTSSYDLYVMDRDGSNRRLIFPPKEEIGLRYPEMAWGARGSQLVIVYQGDLALIQIPEGGVHRLTDGGGVTAVRWQGAEIEPAEGDDARPSSERDESDQGRLRIESNSQSLAENPTTCLTLAPHP
jgi:hypothetical protein